MAIVHGGGGRVFIDGEPIGDVTEWVLEVDRLDDDSIAFRFGEPTGPQTISGVWSSGLPLPRPANVVDLDVERRRRR